MSGPIPARVEEAVKVRLLELIDEAMAAGWTLGRVCGVLELDRRRAWRWQARAAAGTLADRPPGGNPIHGLLDGEEQAIIELFDRWGPVDLSHRKLAHRGSYIGRVWVSPSTVDRVLAGHRLRLKGGRRPGRSEKKPWPDWTEWRPNQLWCWDGSQFERCVASKYAYAIVDIVSRKWIATVLAPEPTGTQVRVLFLKALDAEGLLTDELADRLATLDDAAPIDDLPAVPLLLAVSDNGTEMRCRDTRRFLAVCSIAQHFGRPGTPTDQAWIETLWGHVKHEHPHLMDITHPTVLAAELERIRVHYNSIGFTRPSATSPLTTNTKAAATPSARLGETGSTGPTASAASGTASTGTGRDLDHRPDPRHHHHQPPAGDPATRSESPADRSREVRNGSFSRGEGRPSRAPIAR